MKEPPIYLQSLLHSIEGTTRILAAEFESLIDKDVEWLLSDYSNPLVFGEKMAASAVICHLFPAM